MTSLQSFRRQAGAAVVLALALLACGSSSSSPPPPPPAGAPGVTAVAPTSGPARGGTALTITGTGFVTGATVQIGGVAVPGASVTNATTITCTTVAHAAGGVGIVVTNPDGQASGSGTVFSYVAAPVVSSVAPGSSTTTGNVPVLVQGAGFSGPVHAFFGGVEAASVSVVSATQLAVTVPAHPAGVVDVVVRNADGQEGVLPGGFGFSDAPPPPPASGAPTLTAVSPTSGLDTGGTPVTLTGTNFDATTTALFGGQAATVVSRTATSLAVVTPVHGDGTVDVAVRNGDGTSATLAAAFTFNAPPPVVPPPALASLSPAQGPSIGGTAVTLTGTGFDRPTVTFGGAAATVHASTATSISVTAPAGTAGAVPVTVTNFDLQSSTLAAAFTYTPSNGNLPPSIASMTPLFDLVGGGQTFTITGSNFLTGATVTIGGAPALNVSVSNIGVSITGRVPPSPGGATGPAAVVVHNPDGQNATFNGFPYGNPPPVITKLNFEGQPVAGGSISIFGTGFTATSTVTFGGVPAASVVPDLPHNALIVGVPPYAGALDPTFGDAYVPLVVRNADGQTDTFARFHYGPPPAVTGVSPSGSGAVQKAGDGTQITASGTNFRVDVPGLQVLVGGVPVSIVSASRTQIVFTLPKNPVFQPPNTWPVVVTNFDIQSGSSTDRIFFR